MARPIKPQVQDVLENSPVVLMGSIRAPNGLVVLQSDIASATLKVFDVSRDASDPSGYVGTQVGSTINLTPISSVFYNTPVNSTTDARWTNDDEGYNFLYVLDGSYITAGTKNYAVEVRITPTTGLPYSLDPWLLKSYNLYSF